MTAKAAWIEQQQTASSLTLKIGGEWKATTISEIASQLSSLNLSSFKKIILDISALVSMDTSSAWIIKKILTTAKDQSIQIAIEGEKKFFNHLFDLVSQYEITLPPNPRARLAFIDWLERLGEKTVKGTENAYSLLSFLGLITIKLIKVLMHPSRIRVVSLFSILQRAGIEAMPIISLISFLMGIVLVYQSVDQLRSYGAEIFTVNLLGIAVLREIGILLAAIMIAGRSGSAFTAQIGTMKRNQEIDALLTLGIDPIETLVLPRVIALIIALPLLAFLADLVGLAGGALMCHWTLDMSADIFIERLHSTIGQWTFWVGITKAPIFGFIIALVSCFEGMRVSGSAESIGLQTTRAVVESIFLILVFDAAFSIFFSYIRI